MSVAADIPDGRPSDLYEVKGNGFKAQILVDTKTKEVYCTIAPIMSLRGWSLEKLQGWLKGKERWSLTLLGDGTTVKALKSV